MRFSRIGYSLYEGLASIKRNGLMSLVCITTVALCLTVFGFFILLTANLGYIARDLESQIEIVAYLKDDISLQSVQGLKQSVFAIEGVSSVDYISKADALKRLRERFGNNSYLLEGLDEINPLPASIEVKVSDPDLISGVAEQIGEMPQVEEIDYRQDLVTRLLAVTKVLRLGGGVLISLLAIATIMLISNTIRITVFARRKEIAIMKLVGATDSLISGPFLAEGLYMGAIGAGIAAAISALVYRWVAKSVIFALPFIPVLKPFPLVRDVSILILAIGTVIGALGSWISMRKYLRV